jgi:hypothetical protein
VDIKVQSRGLIPINSCIDKDKISRTDVNVEIANSTGIAWSAQCFRNLLLNTHKHKAQCRKDSQLVVSRSCVVPYFSEARCFG